MGDAADDAFDREEDQTLTLVLMKQAGCRRCPMPHGDWDCLMCHDLGWLDSNGNPCEP